MKNQELKVGTIVFLRLNGKIEFGKVEFYAPWSDTCDIKLFNKEKVNDIERSKIRVVNEYYYINDTGKVAITYIGKNKKRDEFMCVINNMFATKHDAELHLSKLTFDFL